MVNACVCGVLHVGSHSPILIIDGSAKVVINNRALDSRNKRIGIAKQFIFIMRVDDWMDGVDYCMILIKARRPM